MTIILCLCLHFSLTVRYKVHGQALSFPVRLLAAGSRITPGIAPRLPPQHLSCFFPFPLCLRSQPHPLGAYSHPLGEEGSEVMEHLVIGHSPNLPPWPTRPLGIWAPLTIQFHLVPSSWLGCRPPGLQSFPLPAACLSQLLSPPRRLFSWPKDGLSHPQAFPDSSSTLATSSCRVSPPPLPVYDFPKFFRSYNLFIF